MKKPIIYFDHAAATPVDPLVVEAMQPFWSDDFYNPSAGYAPAVLVKRQYMDAKSRIGRVIGAKADEIIMTAGATESVNLAFTAAGEGKSMVSAVEHSSVLACAKKRGDVILVGASKRGRVDPAEVKKLLTPEVSFLSIALANHELGTIQDISEIAKIVNQEKIRRQQAGEELPIVFHTDASQAATLIDIKPNRLGVDLMTLSAAKTYGPKQVGLLWVKPGVKLSANIVGGGQESGLRSGTENVAGVVGFAVALELAASRRSAEVKRLNNLRNFMLSEFKSNFPDLVVSTDLKKSLANFLNVSFSGVDAERLVFILEKQNVLVATGSACAANAGTASTVLKSIGLSEDEINGSLRLTLGRMSDQATVAEGVKAIIEAVKLERGRTNDS